jgi:hypothetical protein
MSEQEMLNEIERLRNELEATRGDRDSLRKKARVMVPRDQIPLSADELAEMANDGIDIDRLLGDTPLERQADHCNASPLAETDGQIEAITRDLARARKERRWVHKLVCGMIPIDPPEVVEAELIELMKGPWYSIDDLLTDLPEITPQKQSPT